MTQSRRRAVVALWWLGLVGLIAWQELYLAPAELARRAWHSHTDNPQDFLQEWAAARDVRAGRPLYEPLDDATRLYRNDLGLPAAVGEPIPVGVPVNGHPPTMALLTLPLTWLTYAEAFRVWNVLGFVALGISVWLVARRLFDSPVQAFVLVLAVLLVSYPLRYQCQQGQLSLLLLALLTGVWACSRGGRDNWAGVLLAVAIAAKLFPALALVYFVLQRRWRAVAATAGALTVLLAATGLVCGWDCYERFVTRGMVSVQGWRGAWDNVSLPALAAKLFDPERTTPGAPLYASALLARLTGGLACLLVLAVLARCLWRARTPQERDGAFALTLVAMLLCSPITWAHAFLLLLLPVCWLWQRWQGRLLSKTVLLGLTAVLALHPDVWQRRLLGEAPSGATWQMLTILSIQMYALLALFAAIAWELRRRPRCVPQTILAGRLTLPARLTLIPAAALCAASPPRP